LRFSYQRGFSKRYLQNSQLAKANADNEAIRNTFRTSLWKVLWVV